MGKVTQSKFSKNDEGGFAPMAIIAAVVAFAIGLGVIAIVMTLMPGIAGDVSDSINVTSDNPYYAVVQAGPDQISSSFNLLYIAALVGVVALIITIVMGLMYFGKQ
jgi:uncharacterized membrane protein